MDEMTKILRRLDMLEKENKELRNRIVELEKKHVQCEDKIATKMMDALKKEGDLYVDKLKKNLSGQPGKVITVKQFADMQDRQSNLIFRGIREHDGEDTQDKRTYDKNQVLNVVALAGIDRQAFEDNLVFTRRLGRKEDQHKFRPILVRLSSQDLRQKALTCNKRLRSLNARNQERGEEFRTRYRIDADLTKEQKDNLDKMWEAAREKTSEAKNGVRYYVVGQENPVMRFQKIESNV